jgi:hypothetical protein
MQWRNVDKHAIFIKATSMAESPLQAEAQALVLAAQVAKAMEVDKPNFLTDSQVLAEAAAKRNPIRFPGHWTIRPHLHQFVEFTHGTDARIFKLKRVDNRIAHKQAQVAYNLFDVGTCLYTCLGVRHDAANCPVKAVISSLNVQSCTLMLVTCL